MFVLESPFILTVWGVTVTASLVLLVLDLLRNNAQLGRLMKSVWVLTVLYSGPLGLAMYFWCGRRQIPDDTLWRRAGRSVAHCYSGCGAGEILGLLLAGSVFALSTSGTALLTFGCAYFFGFALTVGPLVEEGMGLGQALKDAFYSETASITVMEVTAISVDLWLAGDATFREPLFWTSLGVSLTVGLAAAYPVNVWLIRMGVKEGMMDPRAAAT